MRSWPPARDALLFLSGLTILFGETIAHLAIARAADPTLVAAGLAMSGLGAGVLQRDERSR